MNRNAKIVLACIATTLLVELAAASQRPQPDGILPQENQCNYRRLGKAVAALIDNVPPAVELPPPSECFGKVCEATAAREAAWNFYSRMLFEEQLWLDLDRERRACGFSSESRLPLVQ